ncbi:MAG TPA: D-alanyl-D-alanine carboxypeptidase/D-alanyl-D-alanine-endopeptidase [Pyrinomonadaceae bacterium]|nr:D-alanyl-D-alanine carboxypeptidase/D-alanyl-D-alanine-endopeptidase [Pyrinomonadaceae bacterium]
MKINHSSRFSQILLGPLLAVLLAAAAGIGQEAATRPRVTASPTVTPTPSPAPSTTPSPARIQTLDELQSRIRQRLFAPEVRRGRIGVKIVSLSSGRVIFENDSEKYFMPASNMKNFTVAAGLERLGPDFRIITSVFSNAPPDTSGTVKGDLRVFGRGDISISTAFFGTSAADPETYFKGIDRLVEKITAAGVKRVEGSIVGDESYFKGFAIPATWEWDDLQWYYGAEISALPLNDNAVDIAVKPGSNGSPCAVAVSPSNTLMQIVNLCTTSAAGTKRSLQVEKKLDRNNLQITGTMPADDAGFRGSVTFTRPSDLFVALLKNRLESKGVLVSGGARTLPTNVSTTGPQVEIARLESAPFSLIAAKTMKPSQNMYTETILWTLGEQARERLGTGTRQSATSAHLGIEAVKEFLGSIGIPEDGIRQYDGSGLSRHNLITPSAVVTLYTHMGKQSRHAQAWRDSLTIGGVDGTLANRFKGTVAAGNMRGKTGTIDQVSALSGYVTTAGGDELVLSILVNGVAGESRTRTRLIDDIVISLANFNGKVD